MAKELLKGWFRIKEKDCLGSCYIAQAFDVEDARREFGSYAELKEIEQLTWAELSRLTGCIMPKGVNADFWAVGNMMLIRSGRSVILCSK